MDNTNNELIERAAEDILGSEHAIALTGAGMSTESGIPDFRGPDGIWTKDPDAERRAYEAYTRFMADPKAFWVETLNNMPTWITDIAESQPNPGHRALSALEQMGYLKSTITQNIDALHEKAGTQNLLEFHGNLFKLRCPYCNTRFQRDDFDLAQMLETGALPPTCKQCNAPIKSDVVYFGEPIPDDVAEKSSQQAQQCDVMIVCGTSATVFPFASLPQMAGVARSHEAPQKRGRRIRNPNATIIEINAEPTPLTREQISSYLIQGKTGEILPRIVETVKQSLS
jgi:NAD-dependent deacetylase